jgi:hypothetical protein
MVFGVSRRRLAAAVLAGGVAMMVVGVSSGQASPSIGGGNESSVTQRLQARVSTQVSWGTAGTCKQNIETNNFGDLVPSPTGSALGSFDALPHSDASEDGSGNHVWVGCVTANTTLDSVSAAGTEDMSDGTATLPLSDVAIGLTNPTDLNGGTAGCEIAAGDTSAGACTLKKGGSSRTLVSDADEGTTELNWQYQLDLPANQPVGSYTGGLVTFTATAGERSGGGAPS